MSINISEWEDDLLKPPPLLQPMNSAPSPGMFKYAPNEVDPDEEKQVKIDENHEEGEILEEQTMETQPIVENIIKKETVEVKPRQIARNQKKEQIEKKDVSKKRKKEKVKKKSQEKLQKNISPGKRKLQSNQSSKLTNKRKKDIQQKKSSCDIQEQRKTSPAIEQKIEKKKESSLLERLASQGASLFISDYNAPFEEEENAHAISKEDIKQQETQKDTQIKANKQKKRKPQAEEKKLECKFWLYNSCKKGSECPFAHTATPIKHEELCKFFKTGYCAKGDECPYSHDLKREPCIYFVKGYCVHGDNCRWGHFIPEEDVLKTLLSSTKTPQVNAIQEQPEQPQVEEEKEQELSYLDQCFHATFEPQVSISKKMKQFII